MDGAAGCGDGVVEGDEPAAAPFRKMRLLLDRRQVAGQLGARCLDGGQVHGEGHMDGAGRGMDGLLLFEEHICSRPVQQQQEEKRPHEEG